MMSKRIHRKPGTAAPAPLRVTAQPAAHPPFTFSSADSISRRWLWFVAACYAALALYAGLLNGRTMYCDEVLYIGFQKMSVTDLLLCRNNQAGDCMPCFVYFFWRPLALLFGYEAGGFIVSAVVGALGLVFLVLTVQGLFGRLAALFALALGFVHPVCFYYASGLSPYIIWAFANAALLLFVTRWLADPQAAMRGWGRIWLALAAVSVVGLHYGGVFSWGCLTAMASWLQYRAQPRGRRLKILLPFLLWNAGAALLCAPVYVQAQRVADKSALLRVSAEQIWWSIKDVANYVVFNLTSLAGGGLTFVGVVFLAVGVVALFWWPSRRGIAWLCLATFPGVLMFKFVTGLHGYGLPAARHAASAFFSTLLLISFGAAFLTDHARALWLRVAGWTMLAVLLVVNALAVGGIADLQGRSQPFRKMAAYIASLPSGRTVVNVNHYENRFLGGYYPIPKGGSILAPCYYEEGEQARIEGLRRIWRLIPDAILVMPAGEGDVAAAGLKPPVQKTFPDAWLPHLSWRLRTFPEKLDSNPRACSLAYESPDNLAVRARRDGCVLPVPGEGWRTICFRSVQDNKVTFALLSASPCAALRVFSPSPRKSTMRLVLQPFAPTTFSVDAGTNTVTSFALDVPPVEGMVIPTRQTFRGMVSPDVFVQFGISLGLSMQGRTVLVNDVPLQEGWNQVSLRRERDVPFLLLAYDAAGGSMSPGGRTTPTGVP